MVLIQARRADWHVWRERPGWLMEALARWKPARRCAKRRHAKCAWRSTWRERAWSTREPTLRTEPIAIGASRATERRVAAWRELARLREVLRLLLATGHILRAAL